jgi:hypothetical protein
MLGVAQPVMLMVLPAGFTDRSARIGLSDLLILIAYMSATLVA